MRKKHAISLLKEFIPKILHEAEQGVRLGQPDEYHKCSDCPGCEACDYALCEDCEWYYWSLKIIERLNDGEFDEIISKRP
jgi:hypothetical protein